MNCEFCKKDLSTKGNLNYHLKNNKSCLTIQQKINDNTIEIALVNCEFCSRLFSQSNLTRHVHLCKSKPLIEKIKEKDKDIEVLRKEKDKEIEVLRKEKDKDIEVLRKEKDKEIEVLIKEKDVEIEVLRKNLEFVALKSHFQINNQISNYNVNQTISEFKEFKLTLSDGKEFLIPIRKDGYINATQLCKAGNKLFADYQKSKQTQDYLQALSSIMRIRILELLDSKVGGSHSGTYVHRKVAYHLAQWISPHFAVQVSNVLYLFKII